MTKLSLEDFKDDVQRCMRCGFCVAQCPVEEYLGFESNSPRGRMQTIKALIDGDLKVNNYILDRMYHCSLCGYCLWRCPPGVKTVDAIKAARTNLVKNDCYPKVIDKIDEYIRKNHHIYNIPRESRTDWIEFMDAKNIVKIKDSANIIYFIGCVSSLSGRAMDIAVATTQILNRLDLDWTILGQDEVCCGTPLLLSGKVDYVKDLAKHNVEAIRQRGAEKIITPCAGCYRVFTQDYPSLTGELEFEVYHTSQFLYGMIDQIKPLFRNEIKSTTIYHDPCELGRLSGIYDQPRNILKSIKGLKLTELAKTRELTRCCGGGGVLKAIFPDTSLKLALKKIDEFQNIGVDTIVSGCPSCKLSVMDAIAEAGSDLEILDLSEIIAKAIE